MARSSGGATVPPVRFVPRALLVLLVVAAASGLLLPAGFEYERDLLFDGHDDVLEVDGAGGYYRTDVNLATLRPISAMPPFTLDPSYVSPAEVIPARAKRAHRMGGNGSTRQGQGVKQHKREQQQQQQHSSEALDDGDDDAEEEGKMSSPEEGGIGIEDYAARYEKFIAEHFDDVERRRRRRRQRQKSPARQRTAPARGEEEEERAKGEDDNDDDDEDGDGEDYRFDRTGGYSPSDDYERIKAESEEQSRRLAADPRNCRTYEKGGMVCSVCHDPASDSASESCAYATEPHHRKYAYVKERNYDGRKKPEGAKTAADQEPLADDGEDDGEGERELREESRPERQAYGDEQLVTTAAMPRGRALAPHPIRKPMVRSNGGGYRYQPPAIDLRSNRATTGMMKLRSASTDDPPPVYVMDYSDQEDVARVLADFQARDWSHCRRGKRTGGDDDDGGGGGLTCYQCQDAAGVQHEECMYVSESRQVATGIALPPPAATVPQGAVGGKQRKRKKVVPVRRADRRSAAIIRDASLEPQSASADDENAAKEKQTVKRTVSFRSFVTGRGQPTSFPLASDASERRVIHYEHHVSHGVP